MTLHEIRTKFNLTQIDTAKLLNIPVRTYIRYEKDESYGDSLKRNAMIKVIVEECGITETKGVLTIQFIKDHLSKLFDEKYKGIVNYCYLFGSYSKGYATEISDVDLCVDTNLSGLNFLSLVGDIKDILIKKVDVHRFCDLKDNMELISEILKDGIKIYKLLNV